MIRTNFRSLDPSSLTPEEYIFRFSELLNRASERIHNQKENDLIPLKEPSEPLGMRTTAPQGRVPFGFQQNPYGRAVLESETKWIQRIHELASHNLSTEKIAQRLNKEDRKSKRAGKWSRTAVWRILKRIKVELVTQPLHHPVGRPSSVTLFDNPVSPNPDPDSNILPSENVKEPATQISKPLQINAFQSTFPYCDSKQTTFLRLRDVFQPILTPIKHFYFTDESALE